MTLDKIKFITDSACDLPQAMAEQYGITVLSIPITVDGEGFQERVDFTAQEFYDILLSAKTVPSTSHITAIAFQEQYERALEEGCTHVVVTTINSLGSNMYDSATLARTMFYEEHPEAEERLPIYVVDSKTYTIPYGYAQCEAARMAREEGKTCREVVAYLEDFFDRLEIYFAVYSLDFAKKSGRINCAAAFVGEVLGLRPIISIIDGETKIIEKVRGDKNAVPKLAELARKRRAPGTPYFTIRALTDDVGEQLTGMLEEQFGEKCQGLYYAGASITINAGPRLAAVAVLGERRHRP